MEFKTDFLILGCGIAGLSLAIKAAALGSVALVTKKEKSESNTNYAQGGIAAVTDQTDSFAEHIQDKLICGAGLCREDVVDFIVKEAPPRIQELIDWGVNFTKSEIFNSIQSFWQSLLSGPSPISINLEGIFSSTCANTFMTS